MLGASLPMIEASGPLDQPPRLERAKVDLGVGTNGNDVHRDGRVQAVDLLPTQGNTDRGEVGTVVVDLWQPPAAGQVVASLVEVLPRQSGELSHQTGRSVLGAVLGGVLMMVILTPFTSRCLTPRRSPDQTLDRLAFGGA